MAQWELNDGAGQVGPLEEDHVIRMLEHGVPEQTVVRLVGEAEWRSLRTHAPLAIALQLKQPSASPAAAPPQAGRRRLPPDLTALVKRAMSLPVALGLAAVAVLAGTLIYRARVASERTTTEGAARPGPTLTYSPRLTPDSSPHPGAHVMRLGGAGDDTIPVFPTAEALATAIKAAEQPDGGQDRLAALFGELHAAIVPAGTLAKVLDSNATWAHVAITVDGVSATGFTLADDLRPADPDCAGGNLLDWKCARGDNAVPLATFKATSSETPTIFHVSARLSDYFNYEYAGAQKTHYSLEIRDGGHVGAATLHAYLGHKDPSAESLFEALKDAQPHIVTVELVYNKGSRDTGVGRVARFLCAGWRCDP